MKSMVLYIPRGSENGSLAGMETSPEAYLSMVLDQHMSQNDKSHTVNTMLTTQVSTHSSHIAFCSPSNQQREI